MRARTARHVGPCGSFGRRLRLWRCNLPFAPFWARACALSRLLSPPVGACVPPGALDIGRRLAHRGLDFLG